MQVGLDCLGAGNKHWHPDTILQTVPKKFAIGIMGYTFDNGRKKDQFGSAFKVIKYLCEAGEYKKFRIHLWYDKNKAIVPTQILRKRAKEWEELAVSFPDRQFYLSHSCEHNETDVKEVRKRMDILQKLAPHCIPVNNPLRGALVSCDLNETHDVFKYLAEQKLWIVSMDGTRVENINAVDYKQAHRKCPICFFWTFEFNLRKFFSDASEAPNKRTHAPTIKVIKEMVRLANT